MFHASTHPLQVIERNTVIRQPHVVREPVPTQPFVTERVLHQPPQFVEKTVYRDAPPRVVETMVRDDPMYYPPQRYDVVWVVNLASRRAHM